MTESFIKQTSRDYDIDDVEQVARIIKKYPNNFYERLEEHIKDRASKNTNPITIK